MKAAGNNPYWQNEKYVGRGKKKPWPNGGGKKGGGRKWHRKREEMRRQQGKGQMGGNVEGNGHRREGPIRKKRKKKKKKRKRCLPSLSQDMMSPSSPDFFPPCFSFPLFPVTSLLHWQPTAGRPFHSARVPQQK
jgi:hypothetical protein